MSTIRKFSEKGEPARMSDKQKVDCGERTEFPS